MKISTRARYGLRLMTELAQHYGYTGQYGVVVTEIDSNSQARRNGISLGTLVKEVNQQAVRNTAEFAQAVDNAINRGLRSITLSVNIKGEDYNVFLRLP